MGIRKEILDLIDNEVKISKNPDFLYSLIFNTLTTNNSVKNYSSNNNGVFFNMSNLKEEILISLKTKIVDYIKTENVWKLQEENRHLKMNQLKSTIVNTEERISNYMSNNMTYSTLIEPQIKSESEYSDRDLFGSESDSES
jgi:hypothetical protein